MATTITETKPAVPPAAAAATEQVPLARRILKLMIAGRSQASLLLTVMVLVRIWNPAPLETLQLRVFDFYQWLRPATYAQQVVKIVDVDEPSLGAVGQWPWPRNIIARMVERLFQSGAVVVGFDIIFAEPDRVSPASLAEVFGSIDPGVAQSMRGLPDTDTILAETIRRGRVVLGHSGIYQDSPQEGRALIRPAIAEIGGSPKPYLFAFPGMVRNIAVLEQAAAGRGTLTVVPEPDGIVRRVPGVIKVAETVYPSLAIEMLRVATGQTTFAVKTDEAGVNSLIVAGVAVPTDRQGRIWPYFARHDPGRYLSAHDLLAGRVDPAQLAGKLVLIGTSATGLFDVKTTPVDRVIPGVELHAMLIDGILSGALLSRPSWADTAEILVVLALGLLAIVQVPTYGAKQMLRLFAIIMVVLWGGSGYVFVYEAMLLDAATPATVFVVMFGFLGYRRLAREEARRRAVRTAFSRYMTPELVKRLAKNPAGVRLGGELRDLTILFSDVRGFTTISEKLDAERLITLMNRYFTPMTAAIQHHSGSIDKYIGDAIMAIWNAPLDDGEHARHACLALLDMRTELKKLNAKLIAEAHAAGGNFDPMAIGIGLNSGQCSVGNIGGEQRFEYSALGDPVNLASRLEGQSKQYGVDNVISEATYEKAGAVAALELDLIRVKGKFKPVRIYTIVGPEEAAKAPEFAALAARHQAMLEDYRNRRWAQARAGCGAARAAAQGLEVGELYDKFEHRIDELEADPPPPDWDGVYVAKTK
ncbi:MAG: CHASE2 domain-containing protein [Pseudomonadota bacterium]